MKKAIIIILVLGIVFVAKFCTHTVEVVESKRLPNTEYSVATVKTGKTIRYALAQNNELLTEPKYAELYVEVNIIVARLTNGEFHIFNTRGQRINDMNFTGYSVTQSYAVLHSALGEYIYNPENDMLSGPYKEVIPQNNGFWVQAVNGWGILNSDLECIVPTQYASTQQLPKR